LSTSDFDVIVVGGGPAGATAAYFLGLKGIKTLLIDKSVFPRDKACGGGISARVIARFPYLEKAIKSISVNWIHQVYLESPNGNSLRQSSTDPLYLMIRRLEFDNLLFKLAKEQVETLEGTLIKKIEFLSDRAKVHTMDGREYTSKLVIGADGANSIVARQCGLRKDRTREEFAIDMMEETPYETLNIENRDTMYVYYGTQGHYGYGYIFPKADHINLGVGYKMDYYLSTFKGGHYPHYLDFLTTLKDNRLVIGNSIADNFMAFPIPIRGPLDKTYSERVLLIGDAGGFVNAFTAEGIYFAMVTGEHAAEAAALAIERNDFSENQLQGYEAAWKKEVGLDLSKSVKIQDYLLANPSRIDRVVKAAKRDKKLAELLTQYATGSIGYNEFKRAAIIKVLPFYIWYKLKKIVGIGHGANQNLKSVLNKPHAEKSEHPK
jgi:geranylgeranyl reductase family protein